MSLFQRLPKNLLIPLGVTVAIIVTMTVIEAGISDRFIAASVTAADFVSRVEAVPASVGSWESAGDSDVSEQVRQTAGAVGHVSRTYRNSDTGEEVDLWLIVGHARDVVRHTPNVCYISHGFRQVGTTNKIHFDLPGDSEPQVFLNGRFIKEDHHERVQVRVFWAWNGNEEGKYRWDAPDHVRLYYGNNRALYKIYFTSSVSEAEDEARESAAYRFGREMLPVVNSVLFPEQFPSAPAIGAEAAPVVELDEAPAAAADADAAADSPDPGN